MNGFLPLFTLILLAALPVVLAYILLVIRNYRFSMIWFFSALLAGIISVPAAMGISICIKTIVPLIALKSFIDVFINIMMRTALPEELGKFIMIFLFAIFAKRWKRLSPIETKSDGAASGLIIACGFALFETAGYAMSDLHITFVRAISASLIHAACGIRIGISAVSFRSHKMVSGIGNILLAIIIHTAYNFIVLNSEMPIIFLVLIIAASIISSIMHIRCTSTENENEADDISSST